MADIVAKTGESFSDSVWAAPPGLVGTIGVEIKRAADGSVFLPRTTDDIIEVAPGSYTYTGPAPGTIGSYVFTWDDTVDFVSLDLLVLDSFIPLEAVPSSTDVANLIIARTKDRMGNEVGDWTADTRPTYVKVSEIIVQAAQDISMYIDTDIPAEAYGIVHEAIALRAAMIIERSYYPEQISNNRSPYQQLKEDFYLLVGKDGMGGALQKAIEREAEEEIYGEEPMIEGVASWAFPQGDPRIVPGRPL